MKARWLSRRIARPGPCLFLALSEAEFISAMRQLKIKSPPQWVNDGADATTHFLVKPSDVACVVSMQNWLGRDSVEVAGLLVHEAVHVWQEYATNMGERHPGAEQEAYAIQAISQELMAEFARRSSQYASRHGGT